MSDIQKRAMHVRQQSRRKFLKGLATGVGFLLLPGRDASASVWEEFFQKHFRELSRDEVKSVIARLEKEYSRQ